MILARRRADARLTFASSSSKTKTEPDLMLLCSFDCNLLLILLHSPLFVASITSIASSTVARYP